MTERDGGTCVPRRTARDTYVLPQSICMAAAQPLPVFNTRDDYLTSSRDGYVRTIARRDTPVADKHSRFIRACGCGADFSFVIRVFD
ncbi:hypothetical protein WI91_11325 [Burkholderia vietnamiensis]|nr:hypothetical protein WI91_11325 [Burkholderia vietnamiensis]KVF27413.1 hypothetical protein WJ08_02590 [Burkholderia vietnamiensis]KVF35993.1 hypothetical protein WJ10_28145 [Burkholderia vietnamiensis]